MHELLWLNQDVKGNELVAALCNIWKKSQVSNICTLGPMDKKVSKVMHKLLAVCIGVNCASSRTGRLCTTVLGHLNKTLLVLKMPLGANFVLQLSKLMDFNGL